MQHHWLTKKLAEGILPLHVSGLDREATLAENNFSKDT